LFGHEKLQDPLYKTPATQLVQKEELVHVLQGEIHLRHLLYPYEESK
jgi:hypothetical protein